LIREAYAETLQQYKNSYPNIMPSFLFATDGYNFRNTEMAAVLGISQLKKLDSIIEKRNRNFRKYNELISRRPDLFYVCENYPGISSFSLPFICKSEEVYEFLKRSFDDYKIEYRPVVGGNLLNQPFLKDYGFDYEKEFFNVDLLQKNGLYIGNNQYIGDKELKTLEKILSGIR
jgi:CDP-6-deoxy-D-xylo-4-hexulose-3-dehydrase